MLVSFSRAWILGALLTLLTLLPPVLHAQTAGGQPVVIVEPPRTILNFFNGSALLEYSCATVANKQFFTWSVAAGTATNIVVSSNVATITTPLAHGLNPSNLVLFTGGTEVRGEFVVQTVPTTTTFTVTTSGVADGTYTAAVAFSSDAPRDTDAIWRVTKVSYSGSNAIRVQNTRTDREICANRAVTTGATKVAYQ